jgi:hypothetical protein
VRVDDLRAAVRAEVDDYWRRVAGRRKLWLQGVWVDHGLVVLPRAAALLSSGDLITKSESISRLADFGVPAKLAGRSGAAAMASKSGSFWTRATPRPGQPTAPGHGRKAKCGIHGSTYRSHSVFSPARYQQRLTKPSKLSTEPVKSRFADCAYRALRSAADVKATV